MLILNPQRQGEHLSVLSWRRHFSTTACITPHGIACICVLPPTDYSFCKDSGPFRVYAQSLEKETLTSEKHNDISKTMDKYFWTSIKLSYNDIMNWKEILHSKKIGFIFSFESLFNEKHFIVYLINFGRGKVTFLT